MTEQLTLAGTEAHGRADVGATDHFPTPESVTRALLPHLLDRYGDLPSFLEPAAGTGSIVRVLQPLLHPNRTACALEIRREMWLPLHEAMRNPWTEVHGHRRVECPVDFFDFREGDWPLIITNPPFAEQARPRRRIGGTCEWAEACLPLLAPGGRLFLLGEINILGGQERGRWWSQPEHAARLNVIPWRVEFLERGPVSGEKTGGSRMTHCWYEWHHPDTPAPREWRILECSGGVGVTA